MDTLVAADCLSQLFNVDTVALNMVNLSKLVNLNILYKLFNRFKTCLFRKLTNWSIFIFLISVSKILTLTRYALFFTIAGK